MIRKMGLLALTAMASLVVFAQTRTVSGTITDAAGEPVINASVLEKGVPGHGTVSDLDGRFSLTAVGDKATLVFSYVGYLTQEIQVGRQTTLSVVMQEDLQSLDEVVVVGYGTMKRRDLTGSVASVSGERLAANPVTDVAQALQGQLPGVNVISQDGRPGATMSIRVRGGGSITQSNEPLFVVDGVQVGSIDDIPAASIESIDVLKDAATTAIYGARGANGVILITTKAAKEGKASVRYNVYYQTKRNPHTLDVMDAYDYVLWNWSYATAYSANDGRNMAEYFGLGPANGNHLNDYRNVASHNYINDLMRTATAWNHDLSLSGGNADTKYYASVNYADDQGIRVKSDFKRYNANFKINQRIARNLVFNTDLRFSQIEIDGTEFGRATSAYSYRPIDQPLGDGDAGHLGTGSANVETDRNPMNAINNYTNQVRRQRLSARASLAWDIISGLKAESEIYLNQNHNQTKFWDAGDPAISSYSRARLTNGDGHAVRWVSTLNYEIQALVGGPHKASFLLGYEMTSSTSNSSFIEGAGYPRGFTMDDAFGMLNMTGNNSFSVGKDAFNGTIGTPVNSMSVFGRGIYSYKDRYLLTLTFRNDGSSKFAPNHRWAFFPSGAAAWRISDEAFMAGTSSWLNNLKLRLSLGTVGADNIDSNLWRGIWRTSTIQIDGVQTTVYIPGEMQGNPDLRWETTVSRNAGIDFGLLKNSRIHGTIDLYWNTTKDNLMKVPVDPTSGSNYQFQNVGQTSNKGLELGLGMDFVRTKTWRFGANLTYNYNHNNVDKLVGDVMVDTRTGWGSTMTRPAYDYVVRVGQPVGLIQGFIANGFYTVDDFLYDTNTGVYTLKNGVPDINFVNYASAATAGFKRPAGQYAYPGMAKFEDTDGNGIVSIEDATIIGKALPKHTGGLSLNAGYRHFDFSAGFIYQLGGKIYNANAMHSMMGNKNDGFGNNRLAFIADTYKVYDVDATGELQLITDPAALTALNVGAKYPLNHNEYGIVSSQFVEDATYLRLQNLTVGYTLPDQLLKKSGLRSIRAYFTGSNLFCLTKYTGLDPDVNTQPGGENGFPTPNYDYNSYPKARTITFGLNITF
jgi:TonB-linked SusC/RagA family outer membrane protein